MTGPSWRGQAVARGYARRYLARHFHALRLLRGGPDLGTLPSGPLVVAMNHPSWWDPVVGLVLSARFPGRSPAAPIDARALERYPILGRVGAFGLPDGPRGARAFLTQGAAILAQPDRMLWVTMQGRFADPRERPLEVRPGVGHLAARVPGTTVLPLALEYPFWNERTPEALAAFGDPVRLEPGASAAEWTRRIEGALASSLDALGRAAVARESDAFETVVGGVAGVGGVYDVWRRVRAVLAGRAFHAEHDEALAAWRR
jgi:1-acyl-sn-glycerol-3-phosphate acyltransferase